jgi:hypothetical protein
MFEGGCFFFFLGWFGVMILGGFMVAAFWEGVDGGFFFVTYISPKGVVLC